MTSSCWSAEKLVEAHRVAGDPDGEVGVFFQVFHGVLQQLALQHVDV